MSSRLRAVPPPAARPYFVECHVCLACQVVDALPLRARALLQEDGWVLVRRHGRKPLWHCAQHVPVGARTAEPSEASEVASEIVRPLSARWKVAQVNSTGTDPISRR